MPSIATLVAATGVSQRAIFTHAAEEGWTRPQDIPIGTPMAALGPARGRALGRLWQALDNQLADLDGADAARLSTLTRTLEKLVDIEQEAAANVEPAPEADEGPDDIDEFRNEIARRLEGLLGRRED